MIAAILIIGLLGFVFCLLYLDARWWMHHYQRRLKHQEQLNDWFHRNHKEQIKMNLTVFRVTPSDKSREAFFVVTISNDLEFDGLLTMESLHPSDFVFRIGYVNECFSVEGIHVLDYGPAKK